MKMENFPEQNSLETLGDTRVWHTDGKSLCAIIEVASYVLNAGTFDDKNR